MAIHRDPRAQRMRAIGLALIVSVTTRAHAEESAEAEPTTPRAWEVRVHGGLETNYTWAFSEPNHGVLGYRGFDARHNTFQLSNLTLGVEATLQLAQSARAFALITLQVGQTPSTYYAAEPGVAAAMGVGGLDARLWRFVQEAYAGTTLFDREESRWVIDAGLYLSPIGIEDMNVRRNSNWSRSNLFYALPYYHLGARVRFELGTRDAPEHSIGAMVLNGWNTITDNNDGKTFALVYEYHNAGFSSRVIYMSGEERSRDFAAQPWRHLFDAWLRYQGERYELALHGNAGFETRASSRATGAAWGGAALYGAVSPWAWLTLAARQDFLTEYAALEQRVDSGPWTSAPILLPAAWVTSSTVTLRFQPQLGLGMLGVAWLLEYRHDEAAQSIYERGSLPTRSQDSATLGMWAAF